MLDSVLCANSAELSKLEKSLYNHGLGHTQTIEDICFSRAEGDELIDVDGTRYIDFNGTLNLPLGHVSQHALNAFSCGLPLNAVSYATTERVQLCLELQDLFPGYTAFQFYSAGTEANEGAIRYAIAITGKDGFCSFEKSYHGRTRATVSLCSMKPYNGTRLPNYHQLPYPADDREAEETLRALENLLTSDNGTKVAGVFVEPILGKLVIAPPEGFLPQLRALCDRFGILLIADEYLTSIRTGAYSACLSQGVIPDIMTIGKCLGNGIPFAVLMCHSSVAEKVWTVKGSTTFGGNPPACRAVRQTIEELKSQHLPERAVRLIEPVFREATLPLLDCALVTEIRARGALLGIAMRDRETCIDLCRRYVKAGVLVSCIKNVVRITPSLTIPEQVLRSGLHAIVRETLAAAEDRPCGA